jgi:CRP-like cAMP-binding protein
VAKPSVITTSVQSAECSILKRMDDADRRRFEETLRAIAPLTSDDLALLVDESLVQSLDAGAYFLHAGEHASKAALVLDGVMRELWILEDGTPRTRSFAVEGELSGSLADLLSGKPSRSFIEALTDVRLAVVPWSSFDRLRNESPAWKSFSARLAERLYVTKSEREYELIALNAAARYERFRTRWPGLEARVHQNVVASYLGVTPEHLSRVRRHARGPSQARR